MASLQDIIFGAFFHKVMDSIYVKLNANEVDVSRHDFDRYVNDAVFDVMTSEMSRVGMAAQAAPAPVPTPAAPQGAKAVAPKASGDKAASDNKCKYIFGKGANKGNMCGKPAKAGAHGCVAHNDKMKGELVNDSDEKPVEQSVVEKPVEKKAAKKADTEKVKCTFVLTKGARTGEMCGLTAKDGDKCATHAKSKDSPKKPVVPIPKDSSVMSDEDQKVVKLNHNKERDILFHAETGFVFKSKEERVVCGRVDVDKSKRVPVPVGDVRDLTPDEIDGLTSHPEKFGGFVFDIDARYTTVATTTATTAAKTEKAEKVEKKVVKGCALPDLSACDVEDALDEVEEESDDDFFEDDE